MILLKYFDRYIEDECGFPKEFATQEEAQELIDKKYGYLEPETLKNLTIEEHPPFEFDWPQGLRNCCPPGYVARVFAFARQIGRHRQLQAQLEEIARWGGDRPRGEIIVDLYTCEPSEWWNFYWVAHYIDDPRAVNWRYNGGIIFYHPDDFMDMTTFAIKEDKLPLNKDHKWGVHS